GASRSQFTFVSRPGSVGKRRSIPLPAPANRPRSASADLPSTPARTTLGARAVTGAGMFKHLHFPILVINSDIDRNNVAGQQLAELFKALEQEGFEVLATASLEEGRLVAEAHRGLSCILFTPENHPDGDLGQDRRLFDAAHSRSPELPIMALSTTQALDTQLLGRLRDLHQLRGIIYLFEDTMPFIAGQIARTARTYLSQLLPPFFKALLTYTGRASYSWHSPGHGGGVAFRKSPVGRAFHDFF